MIKTYWTKPEIHEKFANCQNLGEVIKSIEAEFISHGEVVCEIRVNGLILKEEDEVKFAESKLTEINDLMVQTNAPQNLITQALASALDYLPKCQAACIDCSELYRNAKVQDAQQFFQDVVEGCFWLLDTVVHLRGAHEKINHSVPVTGDWLKLEKKFVGDLKELLTASEKRDLILVADLLEYEMSNNLNEMIPVLRAYQDLGQEQSTSK